MSEKKVKKCRKIDHLLKRTSLRFNTAEQWKCERCGTCFWVGSVKADVNEALRLMAVSQ